MKWLVLQTQVLANVLNLIRQEWYYFLLALGFFTRIPVPNAENFQTEDLNHTAKYCPIVGLIVGLVAAGSFVLCAWFFLPKSVAVLISMASTIYLTGAFHEDGLADSADGLGGGWQREQILTIMQDSRLGTYGAVALFLALFAKFQLLVSLGSIVIPLALITGHVLSRASIVWVMATLPYAKAEGKAKPLATKVSLPALWIASICGLLPFIIMVALVSNHHQNLQLPSNLIWMTLLPVLIIWLWWRYKIKKWLQGYTGDTLGAMQQITELAFYFGLVLWSVNS